MISVMMSWKVMKIFVKSWSGHKLQCHYLQRREGHSHGRRPAPLRAGMPLRAWLQVALASQSPLHALRLYYINCFWYDDEVKRRERTRSREVMPCFLFLVSKGCGPKAFTINNYFINWRGPQLHGILKQMQPRPVFFMRLIIQRQNNWNSLFSL